MFGNDGIAWLGAHYWHLKVLSDDRAMLVGPESLARLLSDGSLDSSFFFESLDAQWMWLSDAALDSSGGLWVSGSAGIHTTEDVMLVRHLPDGGLDDRFRSSPWSRWIAIDIGNGEPDYGQSIALQSDGKLVVGGFTYRGPSYDLTSFVVRFTADGKLDTSFAYDGVLFRDGEGLGHPLAGGLAVLANNILMLAGRADVVQLDRLTEAGLPDEGFGIAGRVVTQIPLAGTQNITGAKIFADGSAYAWGSTVDGMGGPAFVLRLRPDGSLDTSFGDAGVVALEVEQAPVSVGHLVVQDDGQLLLAGSIYWTYDLALWRLNPDGSFDASFGSDGIAIHDLTYYDSPEGLAAVDGGILVLLHAGEESVLLRLDADGRRPGQADPEGSDAADFFTGTMLADRIETLGGNDTIIGGQGNDQVDGGEGIDLVIFSGAQADYWITIGSDQVLVNSKYSNVDGRNTLTNVERVQFADTWLAFDVDGNAGQAYRLYQAAFDRAPDLPGLGHQMTALDNGLSLTAVASNFIASPEFSRTYGALDDSQFVTQLYANVLHRAPDTGGLAYHVQRLAEGAARADILVGFSESTENQAALIGVIQNGMAYTL